MQTITPQERASLLVAEHNLTRRHSAFNDGYLIHQLAVVANQFKADRTEQEWEVLYADYAENLKEFPTVISTEVLAAHRRAKTWFPKLGELVPACEAQLAKEREDHRRIRILLGKEEPKSFERPQKDDDAATRPRSKEEIDRMLAMSNNARRASKAAELARRAPVAVTVLNDDERARLRAQRQEALERRLAENIG